MDDRRRARGSSQPPFWADLGWKDLPRYKQRGCFLSRRRPRVPRWTAQEAGCTEVVDVDERKMLREEEEEEEEERRTQPKKQWATVVRRLRLIGRRLFRLCYLPDLATCLDPVTDSTQRRPHRLKEYSR